MPNRILPKRILIVRLSAIGDCLLSVPVLNALRRHLPDSKIGWVVERASAQLLQGHCALDDMFVISKQTFKSPSQIWKLRNELQHWKPDTTIDLQGLTKSSMLAWLSGAKSRIGFNRGRFDGRELSTWFNNKLYDTETDHIVDRSLGILGLLGINDKTVEFNLPEAEHDACFAKQYCDSNQLNGRFAMINVGAGWPSKIWPSDRYASVASHLYDRWGLPSLVVWSGDKELETAKAVCSKSGSHTKLAPATNLTQLSSLIRRAVLFVGSDTGPMHLSVAVGTPTVGLIGPMPIERVCPYGGFNIGVQSERLPDERSSERRTYCLPMLSIDVGSVVQACDKLIGRQVQGLQKVA